MLKDEIKSKEEIEQKPKAKKFNTNKEIKKLEKCIKDKDKRITQLEDKFKWVSHMFGSIGLIVISALVLVSLILMWLTDISLFETLMYYAGGIFVFHFSVSIIILVFIWIWDEEVDSDAWSTSYGIAMLPTALFCVALFFHYMITHPLA